MIPEIRPSVRQASLKNALPLWYTDIPELQDTETQRLLTAGSQSLAAIVVSDLSGEQESSAGKLGLRDCCSQRGESKAAAGPLSHAARLWSQRIILSFWTFPSHSMCTMYMKELRSFRSLLCICCCACLVHNPRTVSEKHLLLAYSPLKYLILDSILYRSWLYRNHSSARGSHH